MVHDNIRRYHNNIRSDEYIIFPANDMSMSDAEFLNNQNVMIACLIHHVDDEMEDAVFVAHRVTRHE